MKNLLLLAVIVFTAPLLAFPGPTHTGNYFDNRPTATCPVQPQPTGNNWNNGFNYSSGWQAGPTDDGAICGSSLRLFLPNDGVYQLRIDGQRYRDLENGDRIDDIGAGKRFVKVWQQRRNRRTGRTERQMWFQGFVVFNECQTIEASVGPNNTFAINEVRDREMSSAYFELPVVVVPPNRFGPDAGGFQPGGGFNSGGVQPPLPPANYPTLPTTPIPQAMDDLAFDSFLKAVRDRSFDNTKVEIAEMGLSNNLFTTIQIRQLLNLFSFENSKLKIAKLAYPRVVDPQNYPQVFDVFSFDNSVSELSAFMRQ